MSGIIGSDMYLQLIMNIRVGYLIFWLMRYYHPTQTLECVQQACNVYREVTHDVDSIAGGPLV